ncbi:hypothetical protein PR048_012390 [Dryococelus australis]|uniref:Uncharacterized protein n=1 Tax=Dryococelus australis TaxID=614101 RepID=A0ABQ9HPC8_9NEOP|nr:hypothetical protein PR048_012390 [Dryococelus australis]
MVHRRAILGPFVFTTPGPIMGRVWLVCGALSRTSNGAECMSAVGQLFAGLAYNKPSMGHMRPELPGACQIKYGPVTNVLQRTPSRNPFDGLQLNMVVSSQKQAYENSSKGIKRTGDFRLYNDLMPTFPSRGKREIPEKTRRPDTSSGTTPTCENPGVIRPEIEPGSPWWEASRLIAQKPRPLRENKYENSLMLLKFKIVLRPGVIEVGVSFMCVINDIFIKASGYVVTGMNQWLVVKCSKITWCFLTTVLSWCTQQEPVTTVQFRETECIPTIHKRAAREGAITRLLWRQLSSYVSMALNLATGYHTLLALTLHVKEVYEIHKNPIRHKEGWALMPWNKHQEVIPGRKMNKKSFVSTYVRKCAFAMVDGTNERHLSLITTLTAWFRVLKIEQAEMVRMRSITLKWTKGRTETRTLSDSTSQITKPRSFFWCLCEHGSFHIAHYLRNVRQHINNSFPGRCFGRGDPVAWPARSPDLNPLYQPEIRIVVEVLSFTGIACPFADWFCEWYRGVEVVRQLASHPGKPGSITAGVARGSSHVRMAPADAADRRFFSGISRFPPPLHSGAAQYSLRFALIGAQDLDVKSRPNISTLHSTGFARPCNGILFGYCDL